ncbi:hypothetical protein [Oenococcus sp.]|uniref:hypothetical protein n=1 Tax=Oenococcus sp. TaxID=1979414 RepID=UPI0039E91956
MRSKHKGPAFMDNMFKKFLKVTIACSLITTGVLVAGTVFVVKKIDQSGDKMQKKKGLYQG